MIGRAGRLDRVGCFMAEAELERLLREEWEKKEEDEDAMPFILDVLDPYAEARAELVNRLEERNDHRPNGGRD